MKTQSILYPLSTWFDLSLRVPTAIFRNECPYSDFRIHPPSYRVKRTMTLRLLTRGNAASSIGSGGGFNLDEEDFA